MKRLEKDFFARSCLEVAPELCGKLLCRRLPDSRVLTLRISETEAYNGVEDTACHAHKGKTARSEMLWREPGTIYVYLCYGIHWLMNVITGAEGDPQGVLIRACEGYEGPGKLTKYLGVTKELNGMSFLDSEEIWIADDGFSPEIKTDKRVGIAYADPQDRDRPWRFIAQSISR
ncbi:MAG: DNA-3-methyladenine glycosylase [Oscillospiraceae bacterium]